MNSITNWPNILREMTKCYDAIAQEYHQVATNLLPAEQMAEFMAHLSSTGLVLDLGCGSGRDTAILAKKCRVIGIDISYEMLKHAVSLTPNAKFVQADILNLPFTIDCSTHDNSNLFDAVWCSAVLLHVPRDLINDLLTSLYSLLKADGIIYISVKEGKGCEFKDDTRYNRGKKYWTYFTLDEILHSLSDTGFQVFYSKKEASKKKDSVNWIYVLAQKRSVVSDITHCSLILGGSY